MSAAAVSRRARPAKAPLSREVIVETGLRILDRDGAAALTMRRVAQDLDTGAASLYVYVANRDDLMTAMLDHVLGTVPEPAGASWRVRLTALADAMVAAMSRHEGLALVALGVIPSSPNAVRLVELMLGALVEAGLDDRTASWAVDLLFLYITAAAAEQSKHDTGGGSEQEYLAAIERRFAELPVDRYPTVVAMREALLAGEGDARAAWAVQVLISGILATPAE
ncbi:TetR/AcrR family transcriptional regulator C-terminal domain-containing protein [Nocardia beijingensis]|uniref:TetR/AcrR family transcriptional regulator n=1 Tax=Nocardia beijingensis TaxID=95162 RepID=UPI0018953A60|nr:TetR/AcrR family transcriptional regulator C-terminal domain-containing protein [Nocardia beijingensis]MBF6467273.1 TetR/AcrR family transcriptional regulator C-terminal domain-containing protein [Nocardia beijingensis]